MYRPYIMVIVEKIYKKKRERGPYNFEIISKRNVK